jgi:hypothetical protein
MADTAPKLTKRPRVVQNAGGGYEVLIEGRRYPYSGPSDAPLAAYESGMRQHFGPGDYGNLPAAPVQADRWFDYEPSEIQKMLAAINRLRGVK